MQSRYYFDMALDDGPELGALFGRLVRAMIEREQPILDKAGLSMWEYVVLATIARSDGLRQKEIARRSGRDETRLIAHLDDLADRGLVKRTPDPGDRRAKIVSLTPKGSRVYQSCHQAIARMEGDLLAPYPDKDRKLFRTLLTDLADRTR
jgi:DNA-binding MarR family transcriptional regulator